MLYRLMHILVSLRLQLYFFASVLGTCLSLMDKDKVNWSDESFFFSFSVNLIFDFFIFSSSCSVRIGVIN